MKKPVGLTKDTGWQIGAQRTFQIGIEAAWKLVTVGPGLAAWLGEPLVLGWVIGETYLLTSGVVVEVRVYKPESHLRMTWQPPKCSRASTIQVRALPKASGCVISFHQEHLPGPAEREDRRAHIKSALEKLGRLIVD